MMLPEFLETKNRSSSLQTRSNHRGLHLLYAREDNPLHGDVDWVSSHAVSVDDAHRSRDYQMDINWIQGILEVARRFLNTGPAKKSSVFSAVRWIETGRKISVQPKSS